jgi:hypothetical protein
MQKSGAGEGKRKKKKGGLGISVGHSYWPARTRDVILDAVPLSFFLENTRKHVI